MKDTGTRNSGPLAGFSPLAGVSASTAGVLFMFGVLALAWHRVAGNVSLAISVVAYVVMAAVAFTAVMGAWAAFLWVRHRARNPHLLAGRQPVRAEVTAAAQAIETVQPAAIEPPRVYLNVTSDQLAAIMRHHADDEGR